MRRSVALLAGIGLIALAYGVGPASASTVTVPAGDRWFCDASFGNGVCTTNITAGDEVVWTFSGAVEPHTVTDCGASCDNPTQSPLFDSGLVPGGGAPFSYTFGQPGTYRYYCQVHAFEMRGTIVVSAVAATATSTPFTDRTPGGFVAATPTRAGTQSPVSNVPAAGQGPGSDGSTWLLVGAIAGVGIAVSGAGLFVRRRARD